MKKLAIFLMTTLVSACTTSETVYVDRETGETLSNHNKVYVDGKSKGWHVTLVDLTANGETHQYIRSIVYGGSLYSHWEGCIYCKHHIEEKTENER